MRYTPLQRITAAAVGNLAALFFGCTLRHVRHSCRWHLRGPLDAALQEGGPLLISAWHQDILFLFHYLLTYTAIERRTEFVMLASRSFDGEMTERILKPWRIRCARGSAGKEGGVTALLGLRKALEEGRSVVLISDGPLPPPFIMQPGPIWLARESGAPLYLARGWGRPQVLVPRTWFRLAVPLPRSDIALFSDGPVDLSGDFESARVRAEARLNRLCEEADAQLYLSVRPRGGRPLARRPRTAHP